MARTWLITGGCGFIGRSLIRFLQEREPGANIRILDNLSAGSEEDLVQVCDFRRVEPNSLQGGPQGVELVVGDIREEAPLVACCQGIDCLVHLAANTGVPQSVKNPRLDLMSNVVGIFNALSAAHEAGVKRFVFASSSAPLGEVEPPIHEELAPHPVSPYGASKLAGEAYCSAFFRTFGLDTVCLRFGNVFGPLSGKKTSVVANFIRKALKGEVLEIYGDGRQTRDFIYIGDLVQAIWLATEKEQVGGQVFQIATSQETTVAELTDKLVATLARCGCPQVKVENSAPRLGDVLRSYSDTSKAERLLGWKSHTSLDQGLEQTVRWFLDQAKK